MRVRLIEVCDTYSYIKGNGSLMRGYCEADAEMRKLTDSYANVLEAPDKTKAYGVFWGCHSAEEYQKRFLYQVLISCYNVFDKTHLKYVSILNAIKANNPEWVTAFENDHEHKLARCKVSVYSLEEALTT